MPEKGQPKLIVLNRIGDRYNRIERKLKEFEDRFQIDTSIDYDLRARRVISIKMHMNDIKIGLFEIDEALSRIERRFQEMEVAEEVAIINPKNIM
jgi:hypothetical protein